MRYFTLSADYNSNGIKEPNKGQVDNSQLGLSTALWEAIQIWVNDYRPIIMMEFEERKSNFEIIQKLDVRGSELSHMIMDELKDAKVAYYSEGLLKIL